MVTDSASAQGHTVLAISTVRAAIKVLQGASIHETFPAYLHLRHLAGAIGRCTELEPDWNGQVHSWLEVPGGPPRKPHFRPFTSRGSAYWLGSNLAGSYAPSSLRRMSNLYMTPDGGFRIPENEGGQPDPIPISDALLGGEKIAAWAVAAYLYRNRAFLPNSPDSELNLDARLLLEVFEEQFKWTAKERETLFTWEEPQLVSGFVTVDGESDE